MGKGGMEGWVDDKWMGDGGKDGWMDRWMTDRWMDGRMGG
jgi:hypothetical protein